VGFGNGDARFSGERIDSVPDSSGEWIDKPSKPINADAQRLKIFALGCGINPQLQRKAPSRVPQEAGRGIRSAGPRLRHARVMSVRKRLVPEKSVQL
jgi:hypothetical protein